MAYCTLDDIKKELPEEKIIQLTDDEETGSVNTARVDEAIAKADSLIDGFCGTRYVVPFTTVPQLIETFSVSLSIYFLYRRRSRLPDDRETRYENDLKLLKALSKGDVSLGVQPPPADNPQDTAEGAKDDDDRTFTPDTLKNF